MINGREPIPQALVLDARARSGFRSAAAESPPAQPKPTYPVIFLSSWGLGGSFFVCDGIAPRRQEAIIRHSVR
jgi:hypothetical protein